MSVISTIHSYIDTDPDLLFRVSASNYTLSIDQVAAILMQIKDQQEVGHLVTLQCIKSMDIDPEVCKRYIIPIKEEKPIYLYDIPPNLGYEIFPDFDSLVISTRNGSIFDSFLSSFSKCTRLQIMKTRIASDDGKAAFIMGDDKVCLAPDADMHDTIQGLMLIALDVLGKRIENNAPLAVAKKIFSIISKSFEMVDLESLYDLRPEAQYEAVKIGLGMVSRAMYWLFPTLTLNTVIGLQKYYVPGKDEIDLLGDICDFDEDTYDFLDMCGQAKLQLLIKYVEVGKLRYTPPIKI